ncbi:uncharacterized protein LOC128883224 isoform X2 [Hylaeus volcanicus]|uniref:uncharacterized protein LOC128883224 isoform X2 n=1 Tax=Hylaeus volcanicus TaxID=313075 RepID=UPI0023B7B6C4|nr:uncharacterized protein LOC128883224 isoform X2 [Hylaeus volcanicus]
MVPRKFYCETVNAKNEPVSNFMSNESSTVVKQTNGFCGNAEETEQCFFQRFDFAEIDNQEIECQNICKRNKLNVCAPMVTKMIDGMLSSVDYEKKTETEVFYTNPDMVCTPPPHCLANVSFGKVSHSLSPKITRKRKTLYSSIVDSFNSNGFLYKSPCDEHFCELDYSNENKTVQPTIFFEESPLNLKFKTPVFRENGVTRSSSTTQVSHTTIINGTPQAPQRRHRGNLLYSILDGNTEQVNMALKNGEDPNASLNIPEWVMGEPCRLVPILLASKLAFPTIVQLLLKYGAVLNSVNFQGQNALHLLFSPHRSVREFHQCNNDQKNETAEPVRSISIQKSWEDLESYFQSLPSLDHETFKKMFSSKSSTI